MLQAFASSLTSRGFKGAVEAILITGLVRTFPVCSDSSCYIALHDKPGLSRQSLDDTADDLAVNSLALTHLIFAIRVQALAQ